MENRTENTIWKWIVRNEQLQVIGTIIADRNYVAELSRKHLGMSFTAKEVV